MFKTDLKLIVSLGSAVLWLSSTAFGQRTILVPAEQQTIQAGIDAAKNGDTILVSPGVYSENIDFKGKAITVTSGAKQFADAAQTVISGTTDGYVVAFHTNETASAVLNGFTVQKGHASHASGQSSGGISIVAASPTITNNIVSDNAGCGVMIVNGSDSLIRGNDISQNHGPDGTDPNDSPCDGGPYGTSTGLLIANGGNVQVIGNIIEGTHLTIAQYADHMSGGLGILLDSGNKILLQNNIVRNNISDNGGSPGLTDGRLPNSLSLVQNLFYGNAGYLRQQAYQINLIGSFAGPGSGGQLTELDNTVYGGGENLVEYFGRSLIANNIFFSSNPYLSTLESFAGLVCSGPPGALDTTDINHNDIFNVGVPISSGCTLGAGNISADPQFLNPVSNDFHTQANSQVVAAGNINAPIIPPADLDNKARTVCGTIDMGVYEVRPHPPITLTSSPNPSVGGSSVTFTAKISENCNVPTGTVTFFDGSNPLGTVTLDSASNAVFSTSALFVGTNNITVTYPGDFNFENGVSNTVLQVVSGYPSATSLTVAPNPANAFQPITLTSSVTSPFGTPSGTLTFMAGATSVGTVAIDAQGMATLSIKTLGTGVYSIVSMYSGSTEFAKSSSNPVLEQVLGEDSTVSLRASPNPTSLGQTVTLTATVAAAQSASTLPTGTVIFLDGSTSLGSVAISANGTAILNTTSLDVGNHTITASYGGSSNYNAGISLPTNVVVTTIPSTISIVGSPNPANLGQIVTLTATGSASGSLTIPTGQVTFVDDGTILGKTALNGNGIATFSTSTLSAGTHHISALLAVGTTFSSSLSPTFAEVITDRNFSVSVDPASLSLPSGDYESIAVTVTPLGGFTGNIQLTCANMPQHSLCTFSSGSISLAGKAQVTKLTISTSDIPGYGDQVGRMEPPSGAQHFSSLPLCAVVILPLLMFRRLFSGQGNKRQSPYGRFLLLGLSAVSILELQACSGKLPATTTPGTYQIQVLGVDSDSTLSHPANLNVTVTR